MDLHCSPGASSYAFTGRKIDDCIAIATSYLKEQQLVASNLFFFYEQIAQKMAVCWMDLSGSMKRALLSFAFGSLEFLTIHTYAIS